MIASKLSLKILVVDDNRDNAIALSMLLRAMGHDSSALYDGPSTIIAAAEVAPDLILLDIGMPRMSGYNVCRTIRQTFAGQHMMIVAQTAWGSDRDRQLSKDSGFDEHLVKPIGLSLLAEVLKHAGERELTVLKVCPVDGLEVD